MMLGSMMLGLMAAMLLSDTAPAPMPGFLSGCWEQRSGETWTEECWTDTRGGLMIGSGRTGVGNSVQHWEWMRVERGADGALTFYGSPKGAPAVEFRATKVTATEIIFANPRHDYPQRVHYCKTADGLDAEVSLADGSKPNRWRYKRTAGAAPK